MGRKPKIPPEEKIRLVKAYEAGEESIYSLARKADVDRKTFLEWYYLYKYQVSPSLAHGHSSSVRQNYGYLDDVYFFLKIFDANRETYIRNPKSHKI